jgi:mycofactocin precursor
VATTPAGFNPREEVRGLIKIIRRSMEMIETENEKSAEPQQEVEDVVFAIEEIKIEELAIDGICGVY